MSSGESRHSRRCAGELSSAEHVERARHGVQAHLVVEDERRAAHARRVVSDKRPPAARDVVHEKVALDDTGGEKP